MLYREPKVLKVVVSLTTNRLPFSVSVLYREPKVLKAPRFNVQTGDLWRFSALP